MTLTCACSSFLLSLFILVECATESWAVAARQIMNNPESEHNQHLVALFFISYVLIVGVVLINVVVAVLLDEFLECIAHHKQEEQAIKEGIEKDSVDSKLRVLVRGPLDPLLHGLMDFQFEQELHALILYAFNNPQGSPTERLFALRMITANIEQLSNRINSLTPQYEPSTLKFKVKKHVVTQMMKLPSFHKGKEATEAFSTHADSLDLKVDALQKQITGNFEYNESKFALMEQLFLSL